MQEQPLLLFQRVLEKKATAVLVFPDSTGTYAKGLLKICN